MNAEFIKAIKYGNIDKCRQMLNANPALVNSTGTISSFGGQPDFSVLMLAIKLKQNEIAKLLIERGASLIYESKSNNNTPLHIAVINNNTEMIEYLLQYMNKNKIDTNIENNEGKTPIDIYIDNNSKNNPGFFAALIGLEINEDFKEYMGNFNNDNNDNNDNDEYDEYDGGKKSKKKGSSKRRKSNKNKKSLIKKTNKKRRNYRK